MFVTILSGYVSPVNRSLLEKRYEDGIKHPAEGMLHSFLIRSTEISNLWKIVSVWKNSKAYDDAKAAAKTDQCVDMFCDGDTTPERLSFEVIEKYQRIS